MEIKICGITSLEDASLAADFAVDALGFIFHPKSPRYVTPATAKAIIEGLTGGCPVTVGVFVNENPDVVRKIMDLCRLDMMQLHGDESESYCCQFPASQVIKALTGEMEKDPVTLKNFPAKAFLMDARDADRYGGTGKTSDWNTARKIAVGHPLILAGGLNEANIEKAIKTVSPQAVDINSGIESAPGKKDANKMRRIVEIIRTIELPGDSQTVKIFKKE